MNENSSGFFVLRQIELAQKLEAKQKIRQCASRIGILVAVTGLVGITKLIPALRALGFYPPSADRVAAVVSPGSRK